MNVTPSALPTLNIIWLSVPNLIWSVPSLPTTRLVFNIEVIAVISPEAAADSAQPISASPIVSTYPADPAVSSSEAADALPIIILPRARSSILFTVTWLSPM